MQFYGYLDLMDTVTHCRIAFRVYHRSALKHQTGQVKTPSIIVCCDLRAAVLGLAQTLSKIGF